MYFYALLIFMTVPATPTTPTTRTQVGFISVFCSLFGQVIVRGALCALIPPQA